MADEVCYKVCRRLPRGGLVSAIVRPSSVFCVTYPVGRWATAPVGGLLAFRTLKAARRFNLGAPIYRAIGRGPVSLAIGDACGFDTRLFRWAWSRTGKPPWPSGTVAYRKIKLLPGGEVKRG